MSTHNIRFLGEKRSIILTPPIVCSYKAGLTGNKMLTMSMCLSAKDAKSTVQRDKHGTAKQCVPANTAASNITRLRKSSVVLQSNSTTTEATLYRAADTLSEIKGETETCFKNR